MPLIFISLESEEAKVMGGKERFGAPGDACGIGQGLLASFWISI